jgi:hypothetical protein
MGTALLIAGARILRTIFPREIAEFTVTGILQMSDAQGVSLADADTPKPAPAPDRKLN